MSFLSPLLLQPTRMEGGQYILEGDEADQSTTLIFSMKEEVGALANALKIFQVRKKLLGLYRKIEIYTAGVLQIKPRLLLSVYKLVNVYVHYRKERKIYPPSSQSKNVNLLHIESRPSRRNARYEFITECDSSTGDLQAAMEEMRSLCSYFQVISRNHHDNKGEGRGGDVYNNCITGE